MKNTIIIIVLGLVAIVGTCVTLVRTREQKNVAAEIATRKLEAEQRKAIAKQKESENERRKAEMQKTAAEKKALAARDEKAAEEAKAKTAADERATAQLRKDEAELAAKKAADEKARSEQVATAETAKRVAAEALLEAVALTNDTRQAELEIALNKRLEAQARQREREAEVKAGELKKLELDKRLKETAELQETLRQREEATRPERTIRDIIDENERRRAEEEAAAAEAEERRLEELREKDYAAYEAEMEKRRKVNREGVAGPKARDLTSAEKILAKEVGARNRAQSEGKAAVQKRIVARLEPEILTAIAEGRKEDAEFLLKNLLMLVPEYKLDATKVQKAKERSVSTL